MTVQYENVTHIIERQYAAEQAFLSEFATGNYSIKDEKRKVISL